MPGWDDVERAVLAASRTPVLPRQVIALTGFSPSVVKAQLEGLARAGLLEQIVTQGVRYRLTATGRSRLSDLNTAAAAA